MLSFAALVIIPLVFWALMELQDLLNGAGDIGDDVLPPIPVSGPANLLKLTADEIYLELLHADIKSSAIPLAVSNA
jgi:hypothetical protein